MKSLLIGLFALISYVSFSQTYDTAIAILQPLVMPVHSGYGFGQNNYYIQDSSGYVLQDSVIFPANRNYRFDFTGHASGTTNGTWPTIHIGIDNAPNKAIITINKNTDSIWSVVFPIGAGKHSVKISYTDSSLNGSQKIFEGLLYIFSSVVSKPVKYPSITKRALPEYGTDFIKADDFNSGHLRGISNGKINKPTRKIIPDDWNDLRDYGLNIFRVWITLTKSGSVYSFIDGQLDTLDVYLKRARRRNIYVLIVITNDSNNGTAGDYWGSDQAKGSYRDRVVDVVDRYKDSIEVAGFAFVNEPSATAHLGEYCEFAQDIALSIRRIDTNHVIVFPAMVESGSDDVHTISEPLATKNVVYELHFYLPFIITHQGINDADNIRTEYPNSSASLFWNPAFFGAYNKVNMQNETKLTKAKKFADRYNVPFLVGEFGCVGYAPKYSSCRWNSDAIDIFEGYDWAWTCHSWRTYEPWDIEIPSGKWYGFTYVDAFPQVPNLFDLHQYRTDTTCTAELLKKWFLLNK